MLLDLHEHPRQLYVIFYLALTEETYIKTGVLLGFEVGLESEESLLDVSGHYTKKTSTIYVFDLQCFFPCFFELERVEGLIKFVNLRLDIRT